MKRNKFFEDQMQKLSQSMTDVLLDNMLTVSDFINRVHYPVEFRVFSNGKLVDLEDHRSDKLLDFEVEYDYINLITK